jgi:hypothetical protein
MNVIFIIIWLLVVGFFHSLLELEIEGREIQGGWARFLPTKRIKNKMTMFLIHKEITLYHILTILLFISLFHGAFIFKKWSINDEIKLFGYLCFYFVWEDFCWFLCHPKFRLKNFRKGKIDWHTKWVFNFLPVSYVWGIIVGGILLYLGSI